MPKPLDVDVRTTAPKDSEHVAPLAVRQPTTSSEPLELPKHLLRRCAHPEHGARVRELDANSSIDLPSIEEPGSKHEEVHLRKATAPKKVERSGTLEGGSCGSLRDIEGHTKLFEERTASRYRNVDRQVYVDGAAWHPEERARHRAADRIVNFMTLQDLSDLDGELERTGFHHAVD